MLGLFLLYFIGKAFYELAHEHNKNKWGFAILGVASYYAGTFLGGVILGVLMELGIFTSLYDVPDLALGLITLPIGILACWATYRLLKSNWERVTKSEKSEVLDQDLIQ